MGRPKARNWTTKCTDRRRRKKKFYCCMGFEYVGMWAFDNIATTQMEGDRSDLNLTHPILKWAA